jgi:hypothetical protein
LGGKPRYFIGRKLETTSLFWERKLAILGYKHPYLGDETSLFYGQNAKNNIAIFGEETRYFEGETSLL